MRDLKKVWDESPNKPIKVTYDGVVDGQHQFTPKPEKGKIIHTSTPGVLKQFEKHTISFFKRLLHRIKVWWKWSIWNPDSLVRQWERWK